MTYRLAFVATLLVAAMAPRPLAQGQDPALPVKNGRPIVAVIGDDVVYLDELLLQRAEATDAASLREGKGTASDLALLDRLITVRLIAGEAATMGLADLPEIRKQVDVTSRQILRDVLMERVVKGVTPDPAAVEAVYRDLVREWKTASLLFSDETAAKGAREAIAGGAAYADVAAKALAGGQAKAGGDDGYHARKDYLPEIVEAISKLEVGQVSPVVRIQAGFVVVKVLDVRYPENASARAEAKATVARPLQEAALTAHGERLRAENVVVKQDVFDSLDFAATEPGLDGLLKDTRVVAEIKGAAPLTVADLTDYLRMQFFHGGDDAEQGKRLNVRKEAGLEATLGRRVLNAEALQLGLDTSPAYLDKINAFEESLVFDAFMQKVILPDNKMREEEVKGDYDAHLANYSYPGMLRIRSLAFTKRGAAETTTEKLRTGTDFAWLAENTDSQADKSTPGLLGFDGKPVTVDSLPADLQKALSGAKNGDVRLYQGSGGVFYVLAILDVVPPTARPYDEVRMDIAKKLYGEKLAKSVAAYGEKLRALTKVEIYLKKAE